MTNTPGQPEGQSAELSRDAEVTQAGDTDNVNETILSQSAHSLADSLAKSGASSASDQNRSADGCDFPSEFGRYAITRQLGRGAMGAVFLARDTQLNRDVALKVPTFSDTSPANMIERFYREARSAATLTHPNICPVYDVGEHAGTHFISMGYIEGRSLSAYIESGKKQPERQAAAVVRKLALALQEAHEKGVIHRDLKPANIMIDRRSEPIVMDFGLARLTNDQEEARLTREGTVMGSPAYMSPEQVEGKNLCPQCDVYSLGVVFYELLTGQTPYQGSVVSVIGQILAADPKTPTELRSDITAECSAVCMKAMASDRSDRFQSMAEFAQALDALIKGDSNAIETFVELDTESGDRPTVAELQKRKATATSLIRKKHFKEAVSALESLSELSGNQASDVATWAKQQLPRAQQQYEKTTEESKSLFRRAKKNMAANNYERASQHLDQIPADLRNNSVSDLKAEADELAEEVRRLSADVEHAVRSGVNDGMLPVVERLLELKPQHRQANDLYQELYSNARESRPLSRQKLGGNILAGLPMDSRVVGGGLALAVLIGLVAFWPSGNPSTERETFAATDMAQDDGGGNNGSATSAAAAASPPAQPKRLETPESELESDQHLLRDFLKGNGDVTPRELFAAADSDGDGRLVRGEVKPVIILRADTNGDGELDLEEVRAVYDQIVGRPPRPVGDGPGSFPPPPQSGTPPDDRPPLGPLPGDGRPKRGPGRPEDIFYRQDTNKDGVLEGGEIPPFLSEKVDRNGDGKVTIDELRRSMRELGPDAFSRPGEGGRLREPRD